HPTAGVMVSFIESKSSSALKASTVDEIPGKGMKGSFPPPNQDSMVLDVAVGNEALMHGQNTSIISSENAETLTAWKRQAKSVVPVAHRVRLEPSAPNGHTGPWKLSI